MMNERAGNVVVRTGKYGWLGVAAGLALLGAGCHREPQREPPAGKESPAAVHRSKQMISGAGATFPYPVYSRWAQAYAKAKNVQLNYQSIGSGAGIKQASAGTVDFGASDAPLKPDELGERHLVQWPMLIGGVVPVVNLSGVQGGTLKLTPELLSQLFLGEITDWNDPRIEKVNPAIKLPKEKVTVVHRADSSGTTWIFTNYLDQVSPHWHAKVGTDKAVDWPAGVAGKGNEGVASYVKRLDGAIGYVEYAYVTQNHMNAAQLQNRDGVFVAPSASNFAAAAASAPWSKAPGFYVVLTNQPGKQSWPITGATFILMRAQQEQPDEARQVLDFFQWAYREGDGMASGLDYVPLPDAVVQLVEKAWHDEIEGPNGQKVWAGQG